MHDPIVTRRAARCDQNPISKPQVPPRKPWRCCVVSSKKMAPSAQISDGL
jgi:hypothetical protein